MLLGQLDRGRANAARSAMDEKCLARCQPAARKHIVENGEIIFRKSRRSGDPQSLRHRQTKRRMGKRIFGISAGADKSAHVIALSVAC